MSLSCTSSYDVEYCPEGNRHMFKIILEDSNYAFAEMETFLMPMRYETENKLHFDLPKMILNPTFTYMVNGKEVKEKVQVNFEHLERMCNCDTCWYSTKIERPVNHAKAAKSAYKNPNHTWLNCTFSFELKTIENLEFFHHGFLSGDYKRNIQIFVNKSFQG